MISVEKALAIVEQNISHLKKVNIPLTDAFECILAEDIFSPINMPPFKQSAMDGYALKLSGTDTYKIIGEVQAGSVNKYTLTEGETVRIFTGASVPKSADTVVMQEHVSRVENTISITKRPLKNANVRPMGEQLKQGQLSLEKGTLLNAAALGFLAGLGIQNIEVYKKPSVSILITGNELQQPGKPLELGQVYDSNSISLHFALVKLGISKIKTAYIPDDFATTSKCIKEHLESSDIVLISGGISVGDYDFVKGALEENKVEEKFYKVNQKPGKPLYFGKKDETLVFALPGNPASSLNCFYVYVLPAIKKQMGYKNIHLDKKLAVATTAISNSFSKTLFLKATVENGKATVLTGQASSMLKSFAVSNALLVIPEDVTEIMEGQNLSYLDLNS